MQKHRIAVAVADGYPVAMGPVRQVLGDLGEIGQVSIPRRALSSPEVEHFREVLGDVEAILARSGIFSRALLYALPRLRIIGVHGAGVDQVDLAAATECGIVVANAPGTNSDSVAELTLGFMLALLRKIPEVDGHVRLRNGWREERLIGRELRGKIVGLVGIGNVGRRVAGLVQAFGARVWTHDPYVDDSVIPVGVTRVGYEDLLQRADIVSFHVPLTEETRHMLDAPRLRTTKPGVFVVNTSRGAVVDEDALADGLSSGHVAGAALDVFAVEPPAGRRQILDLPNLIASPHIGGSTVESLERVAQVAAEEIARFLRGEQVRYIVNPAVLAR